MFIAWQYPTSSFVQLYAVRTLRSRPMPASSWKPGYSGRLLFRSFSISSIASDSRPEYLASVSVYRFGFCRRKKKEPEVSSQTSPRKRLGRPTRMSLWKVGWRTSVAPRPFSVPCQPREDGLLHACIPRKYSRHRRILVASRSFRAFPGYLNVNPRPVSGWSRGCLASPLGDLYSSSAVSRYSE